VSDGFRCALPILRRYDFAFSRRAAPEVCSNSPPRKRRVQGMPGARCTRGLVCNVCIEMRTRAYRYSRNTPASPAQGSVLGPKPQLNQLCAVAVFTFVSRSAADRLRQEHGDILTSIERCGEFSPARRWPRVRCVGPATSSAHWAGVVGRRRARSITNGMTLHGHDDRRGPVIISIFHKLPARQRSFLFRP
jgi:hypothetical protein